MIPIQFDYFVIIKRFYNALVCLTALYFSLKFDPFVRDNYQNTWCVSYKLHTQKKVGEIWRDV